MGNITPSKYCTVSISHGMIKLHGKTTCSTRSVVNSRFSRECYEEKTSHSTLSFHSLFFFFFNIQENILDK